MFNSKPDCCWSQWCTSDPMMLNEAFCKALKSTGMQSKQWHFWFDLCSKKCDFVYVSKAEQRAPCLSGGSFQPAWQFPSKKSQWSFTVFLLAERIRGRNVRPCLLDWGISLMTPTCLHDTLGRREYSNKLGPRWASCGKKDIKVAFCSKKKSGQMCHCCFSSPYHLFALGIENYIKIKGWRRVNKCISA